MQPTRFNQTTWTIWRHSTSWPKQWRRPRSSRSYSQPNEYRGSIESGGMSATMLQYESYNITTDGTLRGSVERLPAERVACGSMAGSKAHWKQSRWALLRGSCSEHSESTCLPRDKPRYSSSTPGASSNNNNSRNKARTAVSARKSHRRLD